MVFNVCFMSDAGANPTLHPMGEKPKKLPTDRQLPGVLLGK